MPSRTVKTGSRRCTRRQFLGAASAAALSPWPRVALAQASSDRPAPWWLEVGGGKSRVVEVRSDRAVAGAIDLFVIRDMLDRGLASLTGATGRDGWKKVLGDARRIVIKLNQVGWDVIGAGEPLARALVSSLGAGGYSAAEIALVEAPQHLSKSLGARPPEEGWSDAIPVGTRMESLAAYVTAADAIINVGFLKTHQIAGYSGAMKNISHAVIRRPGLYHADGCAPFVGQIITAPPVASRLRLNVLNALRVVVEHGPDAREEDVFDQGSVLMAFDPLALDTAGLGALEGARRRRGLSTGLRVPYLISAAETGCGRWQPEEVDRILIEPDR